MKIFTIIGAIALLITGYFCILLFLTLYYSKDATYLIPENYQGPLMLIEDYDAKDSVEVKDNGFVFDFRKALVFNKSLVLRQRGLFIEGSFYKKYYYIDSLGNRTKIPDYPDPDEMKIDSNQVYVYSSVTGRNANKKPYGVYNTGLIATLKNRKRYGWQAQDTEDSLFVGRTNP